MNSIASKSHDIHMQSVRLQANTINKTAVFSSGVWYNYTYIPQDKALKRRVLAARESEGINEHVAMTHNYTQQANEWVIVGTHVPLESE